MLEQDDWEVVHTMSQTINKLENQLGVNTRYMTM